MRIHANPHPALKPAFKPYLFWQADIVRIFNSGFGALAKRAEVDLYPEAQRGAIDGVNEWVYPTINNGVYRCGFAKKQDAYETAFK